MGKRLIIALSITLIAVCTVWIGTWQATRHTTEDRWERSRSAVMACVDARLAVWEATGELWEVDYRSLPACVDLTEVQSAEVLPTLIAEVESLQRTGHRLSDAPEAP